MANHKSSEKRARQSVKKNNRNRSYSSMVRSAVKSVRLALHDVKTDKADAGSLETLVSQAQSALHKAVAKGLIHKNKAARSVSRLVKEMRSAVAGEESK